MTPDPSKGLKVFANMDFCSLFNPEMALYDPVTAKLRTRYIIRYKNCPLVWASKLQTKMMMLFVKLNTQPGALRHYVQQS